MIRTPRNRSDAGNALWFILLAIALLTALTITITKSGDNVEQSGDAERATVEASRIMRHAKGMQVAIQTLQSRGISENDMCFDNPSWGDNSYDFAGCAVSGAELFDPSGAGLQDIGLTASQKKAYTGSLAIDGVGTASPDLVFILSGVGKSDCLRINRMVDVPEVSGQPPTIGSAVTYAPFTGAYTSTGTVTAPEIIGKQAGCVNGNGPTGNTLYQDAYHYYAVLIAR